MLAKIEVLIREIDKQLASQRSVNVAIDGNSGAGKTTVAELLGQIYDCNIIHMDDFFLPRELRTVVRLAEVGGNIDYDRFIAEVLTGLAGGQDFTYGVYDCKVGKITRSVEVARKQLTIIEGVYSLHPKFVAAYTLKVFLQIDSVIQNKRLLARGGPALYARFQREWIPMEMRYFRGFSIKEKADLVIDC